MTVRTLTGSSIQAALADARRQYGDDVVLLESTAARDGEPARVTVMLDAAAPRPEPEPAAPLGFGYAGGRAARPVQTAGFSALPAEAVAESAPFAEAPWPEPVAAPPPAPRRPLFGAAPVAPSLGGGVREAVEAALGEALEAKLASLVGEAVESAVGPLADRLAAMEARLAQADAARGPLAESLQQWAAHPLFGRMLRAGMRPATANSLFAAVAGQGFQPDAASAEHQESLAWALAQTLRDRLAPTAPVRLTGALALVGPSGAGKTAMALRLAQHPSFYGRRRTGILVVAPETESAALFHDATAVYRRFGLPVQTVASAEEMEAALGRFAGFDQIIVDTPALPLRDAHAASARLAALLAPLVPLDVVYVLDATRSPEALDPAALARLPLAPRALALTHLDEVAGWGRLADWLLALGMPVQVVSTGPAIPDDAQPYAPGWAAEELTLRLLNARTDA